MISLVSLEVNDIVNGIKKQVESGLLLGINFSQKQRRKRVIGGIKKHIREYYIGVKKVDVILFNELPLTSSGYPISDLLQGEFNFKVIDRLVVNKYY